MSPLLRGIQEEQGLVTSIDVSLMHDTKNDKQEAVEHLAK